MSPVFVRSTQRYQSYMDFWRLVELSGFPIVAPQDVDFTRDDLYIWAEMNHEFLVPLEDTPKGDRTAKVAFWNLERPDVRASATMSAADWWHAGLDKVYELVDALWVSDKTILAMDTRATWVAFGGHPELAEAPRAREASYDVAFLGQRTARRVRVLEELERRGLTVSPNAWGIERARILASSRVMLGIDRLDGAHVAAPLRWALAAAYELPIIQEEHPDPAPLVDAESVRMAPLDGLTDLVEDVLHRPALLDYLGAKGYDVFCKDFLFREQVVRATKGVSCDDSR